uniref:Uncharacterized protein n=1 Tax=Heliothis virescens TaxID=7102 RepID=A0A2A4K120_HELVI
MDYNNYYPESIEEIVQPSTEYISVRKTNTDRDFVQNWVDVTVENEIRRGLQLRQEKNIPDNLENEYNVANINFLGSLVKGKRRGRRRDYRIYYKMTKTSSSDNYKSPYRSPNSDACACYPRSRNLRLLNQQTQNKDPKKCPMRIAELAVPSKRQCIDTWRYKSGVLPEFMVVRLKEHVMDQRPIVQIPEALHCFQKRRPQTQRSSKTSMKYPQKDRSENVYDLKKSPRKMDEKTLCILFAHKITKILLKPLNLSLTLELEAISRVVFSEIAKLLPKGVLINRQNLAIHRDVADKITVWIAGILEDLSLKLLEEDLKDLEEEEGPVLDFIDDVVEIVLNICEPHPVYVEPDLNRATISNDEELLGEEPETSITSVYSPDLEIPRSEEILNIDTVETTIDLKEEVKEELQSKDDMLTDSEHFRNEINNIIDYLPKNSGDDMSNGSGDDVDNALDKTFTIEGEMKSEDVLDDEDLNTYTIKDDTENDIQSNVYEEVDENVERNHSNVIENVGLLTEDDKNSKKVIFNQSELVDLHDPAEQNETSADDVLEKSEQEQIQKNALSDKSSITFAEPNENLLSEIYENDERQISLKDVADKTEESKSGVTQVLEEIIVDELNSLLPSEKHSSESQLNKTSQETISLDLQSDSKTKTLDSKESDEFKSKVSDDPSNEEIQQNMKTETEIEGTISITGGSDEKVKSKSGSQLSVPQHKSSEETTQLDKQNSDEFESKAIEELNDVIDATGGLEEYQTLSPVTQQPTDDGFSQIHENEESQISPTGEVEMTDESKSLDTQLIEKIIVDKLISPLPPDQHVELGDSEKLDITDTDEFESKAVNELSTEEVYTVIELESDTIETGGAAGIPEENKVPSPNTESQIKNGLSKIDENDKAQISLKDEAATIEAKKSFDTQLIEKIIVDKLIRPLTEKPDTKKKLKPKQKPIKKPTKAKPPVAAKKSDKQGSNKIESKPAPEEVRGITCLESNIVGTENGISEEHKIPTIQSPMDHGWKVQLQNAPSWLTTWEYGRGEPSEDSIPIQMRPTRVTETEIRNWCSDLENAFLNLEMWSHWISTTCKETILLCGQNASVCLAIDRRNLMNWNRLRRDIKKDAILWTKLYHTTENTFKCLKGKYTNNIKIVAAEYRALCSCDRRKAK